MAAIQAWLPVAKGLADDTPQALENQAAERAVDPHSILDVLAYQPDVSFDARAYEACCAVGARVFLAAGVDLVKLPQYAPRALKSLFASPAEEWSALRGVDLLDPQALRTWTPASAATREFRSFLVRLLESPIPRATLPVADDKSVVDIAMAPPVPPMSTPEPKKEEDDVTPNRYMFRDQIRRAAGRDLLDPNRLRLHWQRCAVEESHQVLQIAHRAMAAYEAGTGPWKRAIHGALRALSFQASMSIRACFRIPLDGRGDMHLDLSGGFIARDWSYAISREETHQDGNMAARGPEALRKSYLFPIVMRVLRALRAKWPAATTLGEMVRAEGITLRQIGQALNADWPTSHRPEDARFAWSMRDVLLQLEGHPAVIARMSGEVSVVPALDQRYTAIHDGQIDRLTRRLCEWAGYEPPEMPLPYEWRGSSKAPSELELRQLIKSLIELVHEARARINNRSRIDEVIPFHNLYVSAVSLLLEWSIGARCTRMPRRTVQAVLVSPKYALIGDKRTSLYAEFRVVPKTSMMRQLARSYVEHLRSMHKRLKKAKHPAAKQLGRVAEGDVPDHPAFLWIEDGGENNRGYRDVQRADLVSIFLKAAEKCGQALVGDDINGPRHYWYTRLVLEDVPQLAIDSLLGHHTVGSEPHGYFAGVSVRHVADFLEPVLARIQGELGFKDVRGLGRSYERYRSEPKCALRLGVEPIPNSYLRRKIREDSLVIRDYYAREQDPPFGPQTLLAHRCVCELKVRCRSSAFQSDKAAGYVLLWLVVGAAVLVPSEQQALFRELSTGSLWQCGAHAIAEVNEQTRPHVQRSVNEDTLFAISHLQELPETSRSFEAALEQLHELLKQFSETWPARTPAESLSLLSRITSHWCAIEISPGTLFGVFHKAPFIPAEELGRIAAGGRCRGEPPLAIDPALKYGVGFDQVIGVIRRWAIASLPGSRKQRKRARTKACLEELDRRLASSTDVFERALIGQFKADLTGQGAYMRNALKTLAARASKYQTLYAFFRREATFELDVDSFREAVAALGASNGINGSDVPGWVLRHVYHYLAQRGHAAPPGLVRRTRSKRPTPPRLPVYITAADTEKVSALLTHKATLEAGFEHASMRFRYEREVGGRDAEVRQIRCVDYDPVVGLAHITTHGDDDLKTAESQGSVRLSAELNKHLAEHRTVRIEAYGTDRVPLFADPADDRSFEWISRAITESCQAVTGCPGFRRHDLRASACTDICVDLPGGVEELLRAPWRYSPVLPLNRQQLVERHSRYHRAARHARQASALTACRYYNVSSVLDLRREIDMADSIYPRGATYAGGAIRCDRQALYTASNRLGKRTGVPNAAVALRIEREQQQIIAQLRTPELGDANPPELPAKKTFSPAAPLEALMLMAVGMSAAGAATALRLPLESVNAAQSRLQNLAQLRGVNLTPVKRVRVFDAASPDRDQQRTEVAKSHAVVLEKQKRALRASAPLLVASLDKSGVALVASDLEQFLELSELISPILRPEFRAVASISSADAVARMRAEAGAKRVGIQVENVHRDLARFAVIHFLESRRFPDSPNRALALPPRAVAIAGRMFITGLFAAISV